MKKSKSTKHEAPTKAKRPVSMPRFELIIPKDARFNDLAVRPMLNEDSVVLVCNDNSTGGDMIIFHVEDPENAEVVCAMISWPAAAFLEGSGWIEAAIEWLETQPELSSFVSALDYWRIAA